MSINDEIRKILDVTGSKIEKLLMLTLLILVGTGPRNQLTNNI